MYKLYLDLAEFLAAGKQVGAILNVQSVQKAVPHTLPAVEGSRYFSAKSVR